MKKLHVIIEPGKDGFGVIFKTPGLENLISFGETLDEAKQQARNVLSDMLAFYLESDEDMPEVLKGINPETVELKFSFLLQYYLKEYPFLNVSKLATQIKINPSLLRQYDKGLSLASEDKYLAVKQGLHSVGKMLEAAL